MQTSEIHRNSTVAPNQIIYIRKIIRKIQSIHLCYFHAWKINLYLLYKWKHSNGILNAQTRVCIWTFGSNGPLPNRMLNALAQRTSHTHAMIMHHIVAYACVWLSTPFLLDRSCSGDRSRVPVWGAVPPCWSTRQANLLVHSDKILPSRSCSHLLH